LTEKLIALECEVVAVDQSAAMVDAARGRGIQARVADARRLEFDGEFDAVFSNAVLHWVSDADAVVKAWLGRCLPAAGSSASLAAKAT
jgi:trans-aconitate methyltransferase